MTTKLLTEILTKQAEFRRDGDRLLVPAQGEATVFSTVGAEALIIDKVAAVKLLAEVLVVETTRGDRYFVAHEDVRAVRVTQSRAGTTGYA